MRVVVWLAELDIVTPAVVVDGEVKRLMVYLMRSPPSRMLMSLPPPLTGLNGASANSPAGSRTGSMLYRSNGRPLGAFKHEEQEQAAAR